MTLEASGEITTPWQEASVGAQIGGYQLTDVYANVGDQVSKGQILARFDPALLQADESVLKASDDQAEANQERALHLRSTGATSDKDALQYVTQAKTAAALLASKRLQLRRGSRARRWRHQLPHGYARRRRSDRSGTIPSHPPESPGVARRIHRNLPIQNIPDIDLPTVNVGLIEPGSAPAQLETEVARRVENSLATLSGLKHIRTSITDGRVSIKVQFVLEKPISEALIETKDAVDRVRSDLPADLLQPTVSAVTIGGEAVLVYATASTRMDEEALSWFTEDTVAKAVLSVPGVGRFERVGGVQREVRVEVDSTELAALGVTPGDISRALRQVQQDSSGAKVSWGCPNRPCGRLPLSGRLPSSMPCLSPWRTAAKSVSIRWQSCATASPTAPQPRC